MKDLIVLLTTIHSISKDIHYSYKGSNFYSIHLLMDRINKGLLDYVDEIKENYFMQHKQPVPTGEQIYGEVIGMYTEVHALYGELKSDLERLELLIDKTILYIDDLAVNELSDNDMGDNDLLGRISSTLKTSSALLGHVIEG